MSADARQRSKYLYPKTVKGKPYLYFRMADGALVALPLDQNSVVFKRSYDTCLMARGKVEAEPEAVAAPVSKHVAFIGGTVGNAITGLLRRYLNFAVPRAYDRRQYLVDRHAAVPKN